MMPCFEISLDHSSEVAITYRPCPEKEVPSPWPQSWWNALTDTEYTHDGHFGSKTRVELENQWIVINPVLPELPDVIGEAYPGGRPPLVVNEAMKEVITVSTPGVCDFVKARGVWDKKFQREILDPEYFFLAVLPELDAWDREFSNIVEIRRRDGSKFYKVRGKKYVRSSVVQDCMLWRDALTGSLMCSNDFKILVEATGCQGISFHEVLQSKN